MKNLQHNVCIFCEETVEIVRLLLKRKCAAASQYIFFYIEGPRNFQADSVMMMFAWDMDPYPKQSLSFFSLLWCPTSIKDVFHNHWKIMKNLYTNCVYFCAETVNDCFWKKKCSRYFLMLKTQKNSKQNLSQQCRYWDPCQGNHFL